MDPKDTFPAGAADDQSADEVETSELEDQLNSGESRYGGGDDRYEQDLEGAAELDGVK